MRKKFLAGILAGAIFFTPIEIGFSLDAPVAEAAKFGGIRVPKAPSSPKVNLKKDTPAKSSASTSDGQKAVSGSGAKGQYQPSKNPKDLQKNAPASPTTSTGSRWGNTLRNIGLFAGGMFLGSMLASMFGFGGLFGDILGALANVILFGAVIMLAMWAWRKFKNRNNPDPVPYQDQKISPVTRFDSSDKIGVDYNAKRAADIYRNR